MARLTIDDRQIEAPDGAPLVEVIKNAGIYISNLCYVDGLSAYSGCRTCLVEIEGARGLQLSCTTKVADGMVVRTDTNEVKDSRRAVLSLILSYHSDRCLTCHRVTKCKPGGTCLRDNVVTHRCLTCSKDYRCELQSTCEMLEMAGYEPWEGEDRTYYHLQQPEPDHGNSFLEFDPQMCIICTRCVRTCDEIRHTGAIALAGRGSSTRIEFGVGGQIHESSCDFCGACIDICPTATLMEHPNKWAATQVERWVSTVCIQCSVGCTISLGVKGGRGVIVRPDPAGNPVSSDQLCVRGRFHYDAVKPSQRLSQPLIRRNGGQKDASWDEALELTAVRLAEIREKHGPQAIGFLGSPFATNEENYLMGKIARAVVGTNNLDSSLGPVARGAAGALATAFGSEVLPADLLRLADSRTILVVADDLESSHNVACLRIKDAVVRNGARLVVVSARRGELCDFAEVWLRPHPSQEAAVMAALANALVAPAANRPPLPAGVEDSLPVAVELLSAAGGGASASASMVYALPHFGPESAAAITAALANIAVTCCGEDAAEALFVLPQEGNLWGMRDAGISPELLPGHRLAEESTERHEVEQFWGAHLPSERGLTYEEMLAGPGLKALVVLGDNPLLLSPDQDSLRHRLGELEFLAVIDAVATDVVRVADVVLADVAVYGKEGTTTSADRRILRLHSAMAFEGGAQPAWRILGELGARLSQRLQAGEARMSYHDPAAIMDEMAQLSPLYADATYRELESGAKQRLNRLGPTMARLQSLPPIVPFSPTDDGFLLTTGRSLYTSYEGAALHRPDADKLHREEFVEMNPADAAALGIGDGEPVVLRSHSVELAIRVRVTAAVQPRTIYVPLYFDGGVVGALFSGDRPVESVTVAAARVAS